jgi:hypothetical protein
MKVWNGFAAGFVAALVALGYVGESRGDVITDLYFSGSTGSGSSQLSASADFSLDSTTHVLTVTLTNTSLNDVLVPTDVLTGVDFNTNTSATHTLTPVSASSNGSSVFYGSVVNNVGEGWQYLGGISAQGKNSGISGTGLNSFGPSGNFFSPGVMVDGLDYGILSAGDDSATGNTGVTGHGPLFKNSLKFTLNTGSNFSLTDLGVSPTVVFQYGTAEGETHYSGGPGPNPNDQPPVPEPTGIAAMLGLATMGLIGLVWRRRKQGA